MFTINHFRKFREWSTFTNVIIANHYVRTYTSYLSMHYFITTGDVTIRWQMTFAVAIAIPHAASVLAMNTAAS